MTCDESLLCYGFARTARSDLLEAAQVVMQLLLFYQAPLTPCPALQPKTNTSKKSQGNTIKAQQFSIGLGPPPYLARESIPMLAIPSLLLSLASCRWQEGQEGRSGLHQGQ